MLLMPGLRCELQACSDCLQQALQGGEILALAAAGEQLDRLPPDDRVALLRYALPRGETCGALFDAAAARAADPGGVWAALRALTDIAEAATDWDLQAHFCTHALLSRLSASLGRGRSAESRSAAHACVRHLVRAPLLAKVAIANGVVPVLLEAIWGETAPGAAEEGIACLGALAGAYAPAAGEILDTGHGAAPIVGVLGLPEPGPVVAALGLLVNVCAASGSAAARLAGDAELAGRHLPRLLASEAPRVRSGALRLCALLVAHAPFRGAFAGAGGVDALRRAAAMEDLAPVLCPAVQSVPAAGSNRGGLRSYVAFTCANGCCDGPGPPELDEQLGSTRREMAEELVAELERDATC